MLYAPSGAGPLPPQLRPAFAIALRLTCFGAASHGAPLKAATPLLYCPAPDRYTAAGETVLAGSLITIAAVRVPIALGANVMLMLQLAPGASDPMQLFVCAKSLAPDPVIWRLEIICASASLLVSTAVSAALVVPWL